MEPIWYALIGFVVGCFVVFLANGDRKPGNMTKEELCQAVQIALCTFSLSASVRECIAMRGLIDEICEYAMAEDKQYTELSDEAQRIVNKVQGEAEAYL